MSGPYYQLLLSLNECMRLVMFASKNYDYMVNLYRVDKSITDYYDKTRQMADELPHLVRRAEDLRKYLEEFNSIAMR